MASEQAALPVVSAAAAAAAGVNAGTPAGGVTLSPRAQASTGNEVAPGCVRVGAAACASGDSDRDSGLHALLRVVLTDVSVDVAARSSSGAAVPGAGDSGGNDTPPVTPNAETPAAHTPSASTRSKAVAKAGAAGAAGGVAVRTDANGGGGGTPRRSIASSAATIAAAAATTTAPSKTGSARLSVSTSGVGGALGRGASPPALALAPPTSHVGGGEDLSSGEEAALMEEEEEEEDGGHDSSLTSDQLQRLGKNWTQEEETQLLAAYRHFGPRWNKIASCIHNRIGVQSKWKRMVAQGHEEACRLQSQWHRLRDIRTAVHLHKARPSLPPLPPPPAGHAHGALVTGVKRLHTGAPASGTGTHGDEGAGGGASVALHTTRAAGAASGVAVPRLAVYPHPHSQPQQQQQQQQYLYAGSPAAAAAAAAAAAQLTYEPAGSVSWMGSHRPGDAGGVASTLVSPLASLASTSGRMSAGGSGSGAAASSMHHANMHHALTPASNLYGNQYGAASTSAGTPLSTAAAAAGCVAATSGVTDMAWEPCMVPGGSSSVAAGGSFDADANGSARGSVLPRLHTAMAAVGGMPMMAAANQHAAATGFYPTSMPMLGGGVRQVALVVSVPEPTMPQRMFADSEGVEAWMLHYAEAYAENFASAYAYSIMEGYADALRNYASSAAFPAYGWAGAPAMPHPAPGAWTTAAATAPTGTTGCGGAGDWSGGYACSTTGAGWLNCDAAATACGGASLAPGGGGSVTGGSSSGSGAYALPQPVGGGNAPAGSGGGHVRLGSISMR